MCPKSREIVFGHFWETYSLVMFWSEIRLLANWTCFRKKMISGGSSVQTAKIKSIVYWSSRYDAFTKLWVFCWCVSSNLKVFLHNVNQPCFYVVKTYFTFPIIKKLQMDLIFCLFLSLVPSGRTSFSLCFLSEKWAIRSTFILVRRRSDFFSKKHSRCAKVPRHSYLAELSNTFLKLSEFFGQQMMF